MERMERENGESGRETEIGSERERERFTSESLTAHWVSVGVKQSSLLPPCASLPGLRGMVPNTAPQKRRVRGCAGGGGDLLEIYSNRFPA